MPSIDIKPNNSMCVVQEERQMIRFPMFIEFALHEKQPPETVTGFKLTVASCRMYGFLSRSVVLSLNKTKKALVYMCGFVARKSMSAFL